MSIHPVSQPVDVRPEIVGANDDRWARWAATGAEHDRTMHRRTVVIAAIIGASLAIWGAMAFVIR